MVDQGGRTPSKGRRDGAFKRWLIDREWASLPADKIDHRRGAGVVDRGGLENRCTPLVYRGFESHPLRQPDQEPGPVQFRTMRLRGGVPEWTIGHAWRACVPPGTVGSNPTPSASTVLGCDKSEAHVTTASLALGPLRSPDPLPSSPRSAARSSHPCPRGSC